MEHNLRARRLIIASRILARDADRLSFSMPVRYIYNPLAYARVPYEMYLARFAAGPKRVIFLGMNPGPWGMAQTGVPFGEVAAVRDWLGISGDVKSHPGAHPRVPVTGFSCSRSEVSGARLWGLLRDEFGPADRMAREVFVSNYCPLMFLDEDGKNLTPDGLSRADQPALFEVCDRYLETVIETLRPEWLIGVGRFAERRLEALIEKTGRAGLRVSSIMHPSPANPKAHNDWAGQVSAALVRDGVWRRREAT
jgi:single-strand selective monofunctional uracil DNA glycosylase